MQEAIVALIVACAAWAVAKRYLPKAAKQGLRTWCAHVSEQCGMQRLAKKLQEEVKVQAACGDGCNTCGSCDTAGTPSGESTQTRSTITPEALRRTAQR